MTRFVGKFVGTILGYTLAGPAGAFIGLIIGHLNDQQSKYPFKKKDEEQKNDYFPDFRMGKVQKKIFAASVITLGAKLAKADGIVRREEVLAFRRAFRTPDRYVNAVGSLFDEARRSTEGYETYAARLAQTFGHQSPILEEVLAGLFYIAMADSYRLSRPEMVYLRRVSVLFGFHEEDFVRIAARVGLSLSSSPPPVKHDTAYDVLGLPTTASEEVIKKTYRALVRKYHPDKLVAAGMPAEKVSEATEKIKRINAAYSEICSMRGMK